MTVTTNETMTADVGPRVNPPPVPPRPDLFSAVYFDSGRWHTWITPAETESDMAATMRLHLAKGRCEAYSVFRLPGDAHPAPRGPVEINGTSVALDRPMFTIAPIPNGWAVRSVFLAGIDPSFTEHMSASNAHSVMECCEYAVRKALGLPDWREPATIIEMTGGTIYVKGTPASFIGNENCMRPLGDKA
jgi:hypothetical protein